MGSFELIYTTYLELSTKTPSTGVYLDPLGLGWELQLGVQGSDG